MIKPINFILYLLLLFAFNGCKQHDSGHRGKYDAQANRVDVKPYIHAIEIDAVDIARMGAPHLLNDYLLISDYHAYGKLIHVFDKNQFTYITSVGDKGRGSTEIANMGNIIPDGVRNTFYVINHRHQVLYNFPMDSILANSYCAPTIKARMNTSAFPFMMQYVNDTLSYALFMKVIEEGRDYIPVVAQWNMLTGERKFMHYARHPEVEKKRVNFAASLKYNLYDEAYWYHDLITLCT